MDIQNVKVTLGRVRARGALIIRQGNAQPSRLQRPPRLVPDAERLH